MKELKDTANSVIAEIKDSISSSQEFQQDMLPTQRDEILISSQGEAQDSDIQSEDDEDQSIISPEQGIPRPLPSLKDTLPAFEATVDPTGEEDPEVDDSETESESSDEDDIPLTQTPQASRTMPRPANQSKTDFCKDAVNITVPAHLDWVASHTNFKVETNVNLLRRPRPTLSSLGLLPELDTPEPFVGLTTSDGIVAFFRDYAKVMEDFKPTPMRQAVGIYSKPSRDTPSVNMTTFMLSDERIKREPLKAPKEPCEFLGVIKYNYQTVTREEDLRRLEEYSRKALTILSDLDATLTAAIHAYPESQNPDSNFMKALYRTTQGLQALTEIHVMSLHQLVIHRRDTVINAKMRAKSNPVIISDEHLSKLRYGPIIGAEELFDPEIVRVWSRRGMKRRRIVYKPLR